ncbi:hypothetical protein ACJMK2_024249 [Sinanodonta woodiana]|uniref:Uncharacterized protein n=1 Tax=Sinanodonta woodiana TaxID=1069815 RepID=A0ABD3T6T3_SINWO
MIPQRCALFFIFLYRITSIQASLYVIEAENARYFEGKQAIPRSEASGNATIKLFSGQNVSFDFCLMTQTDVAVEVVWYSNDSATVLVTVSIDHIKLPKLVKEPLKKDGQDWIDFKSNEPLGSIVYLLSGRHRLNLYVDKANDNGVELDKIVLIMHTDQDENTLDCTVFCFDDILYDQAFAHSGIGLYTSKGKLVQKSKITSCAEDKNINIPIFHENVRKFVISANLPRYTTFSNRRTPNWTNCKLLQPSWLFRNLNLSQTQMVQQTSGNALLSVTALPINSQSNLTTYELIVEFSLDGPSHGLIDSEIGSAISIKLTGIQQTVEISMQYFGRLSRWSEPTNMTVDSNTTWKTWNVPDFAWKEGNGNSIKLIITAFREESLQIKDLSNNRRSMAMDQTTIVYQDGITILEVVDVDGWWRMNETMTLKTTHNGKIFQGVDYFRIYRKTPWSKPGFCQVFIMYQDGNMRLLPITPNGLDWIPFGSSILMGQSDPTSIIPFAALLHVDVDPKELAIRLTYRDGSIWSLNLHTTIQETIVIVSDVVFTRSLSTYPFISFRSTWVADGNADVDHVSVDGKKPFHIISGWETLRGNSYAFYRTCISKHNTLSPDIRVRILD